MIEIPFGQKTKYKKHIALGFFDCLHVGHVALIDKAKSCGETALFTFSNDISPLLTKKDGYIYTFDERKARLKDLGVDCVIVAVFDESFKALSPEKFLDELFDSLTVLSITCGEDYTFGKNGEGNVEFLEKYCGEKNIPLNVVQKVFVDGLPASTTLAKEYLKSGEIEKLNALLGARYKVVGVVEHGEHNGTKIGFPTANVTLPEGQTRLKEGVYGGYVTLDGRRYKAIINAGARPTLSSYKYKIECHLDGNFDDLYGKTVAIEFLFKIRDIKKFADLSKLCEQLQVDEKSFERL